jgi:predicted SprT family Zn-dependent metalloprotease
LIYRGGTDGGVPRDEEFRNLLLCAEQRYQRGPAHLVRNGTRRKFGYSCPCSGVGRQQRQQSRQERGGRIVEAIEFRLLSARVIYD